SLTIASTLINIICSSYPFTIIQDHSGLVETVEGRVSILAMLCDIESDQFILLVNTKFCKDPDNSDTDQGTDYCYSDRYKDTDDLCDKQSCLSRYETIPLSN